MWVSEMNLKICPQKRFPYLEYGEKTVCNKKNIIFKNNVEDNFF